MSSKFNIFEIFVALTNGPYSAAISIKIKQKVKLSYYVVILKICTKTFSVLYMLEKGHFFIQLQTLS